MSVRSSFTITMDPKLQVVRPVAFMGHKFETCFWALVSNLKLPCDSRKKDFFYFLAQATETLFNRDDAVSVAWGVSVNRSLRKMILLKDGQIIAKKVCLKKPSNYHESQV